MGRRYDREFLLSRLKEIRSLARQDGIPIQIGADLIVGFPGESEEDFSDTCSLVEEYGISQLHAFPFSAHAKGYPVPAGNFPDQIDEKTKTERLQRLIGLGDRMKTEFLGQNKGKHLKLLLEGRTAGERFSGWSENYIALDESNFIPDSGSVVERGRVIDGVFHIPSCIPQNIY